MTRPVLNNIELPATDLDATKAFYTEVFGWKWIDYGPTYSAAQTDNGLEIGFNTEATVAPPHDEGEGNAIGPLVLFQADELESNVAKVVDSGGEIRTPPHGFPGGSRFHFQDPSGNVLGIFALDD